MKAWLSRVVVFAFFAGLSYIVSYIDAVTYSSSPTVLFPLVLMSVAAFYVDYFWVMAGLEFLMTIIFCLATISLRGIGSMPEGLCIALAALTVSLYSYWHILTEYTDRAYDNRVLKDEGSRDLLTGLLNKISTEQKVTDYLTEAGNKGQSAILFLIDIDNFKKVNDTMGHAFGDELLAGLGVGLSTLFRATDIVGRIGGDEFLVLMRNVVPDEETKKREAEKLLTFFRDFKVGEYVQYKCTASIGGAVFSKDGGDFDELYKAADNAMYESKRHGKNRVAYYGEVLEGPVTELGRH